MTRIDIYDTTLRDGSQGEGISFSVQDKLLIARRLDEQGIDFIEGGYPLSNPKDEIFFQDARGLSLAHARLVAFGMTRRRGVKACDDVGLRALVAAETQVVTLVGKTWDLHATDVLGVSLEENLDMIRESVAFLKQSGRMIIYDAEHFFDGCRANHQYAMRTLHAAIEGGADLLCLCDTNGGTLPEQVAEHVRAAVKQFNVPIGIHPHNDSGLAVANALAAVRAGATQVQGTINGIGERCGNVDLTTVIANLKLKMGCDCLREASLGQLTQTARYIYEIANLNMVNNQPYVGLSAFAHKGGMHVHAVNKLAHTYEHVPPESVGNARRILVSELSGVSNIAAKFGEKFNIANDRAVQRAVLEKVTELEAAGYQFEAAEGSFELLLRRQIGRYRTFFTLDHYRCAVNRAGDGAPATKVALTLVVNGRQVNASATGDGPVNALDGALRRALSSFYPELHDLHLVDYKVRVVNSRAESAAKVRVVIEFRSPEGVFGVVGVSENIIEASYMALVDALEYRLLHAAEAREEREKRPPSAAREAEAAAKTASPLNS